MKTAISIPDDLFEAAERLARHLGVSRSHLYQQALVRYLASHDEAAVTEGLDAVHGGEDPVGVDPVLEVMQRESLERDDW